MKHAIITILLIVTLISTTVITFASEAELTGIERDGHGDYYLSRNEIYEKGDMYLNGRIKAGKKKGYLKEIPEDFITEHLEFLMDYYRLGNERQIAESELMSYAIRNTDDTLKLLFLQGFDINQYLEYEGDNYTTYEINELNNFYSTYQLTDMNYKKFYEANQIEMKTVLDFILESNGRNFTWNHYVLKYRVDDRLARDQKTFLYQYVDEVEEVEEVEQPEPVVYAESDALLILDYDYEQEYIIVKNMSQNYSLNLDGFKMISEDSKVELSYIILKPNEELIIGSSKNDSSLMKWDGNFWNKESDIEVLDDNGVTLTFIYNY